MNASLPGVCGVGAFRSPAIILCTPIAQNANCINKLVLFWGEGFSYMSYNCYPIIYFHQM